MNKKNYIYISKNYFSMSMENVMHKILILCCVELFKYKANYNVL